LLCSPNYIWCPPTRHLLLPHLEPPHPHQSSDIIIYVPWKYIVRQNQQLSFSPFQATILSTNGHGTDNHHLLIHFTCFQWIKRMMNSGPMMVIKAAVWLWCVIYFPSLYW
jgi:hypothetical protein